MQNYIFYLLPGFGDKILRPLQAKIKYQIAHNNVSYVLDSKK